MILAILDRFGYELTTIAETKEQAIKTIMKEYSKAYKAENGTTPGKDYVYEGTTYYALAKEEISICEINPGEVEWR